VFVAKLWNTAEPDLPYKNFSWLFAYDNLWLLFHVLSLLECLVMLRVKRLVSGRKELLAGRLLIRLWSLIGIVGIVALLRVVILGLLVRIKVDSLGMLEALLVRIHLLRIAGLLILILILMLLHILKPIVIYLDVDFPVRLLLIDFLDGFLADIFTALHHNKGIAEAIKVAPSVALDDSI
jgi:hypothetical protein